MPIYVKIYVISYTYGDSTWADLLTSYNGTTINYDAMGNPTSYYNGKSYVMAWQKGRQASMMFCDGSYKGFKYNADGIRTEKQVTGQYTEKYRLDGDRVVELVRKYNSGGTYRLAFAYDESGNPFSVDLYTSATDTVPDTYYYVLNLQGDVIQLLDENDSSVAYYTYDAWGKVLSVSNASNANIVITTHISNLNPFKYRGYFYDIETGFYYCNSRYYDPQMRRFINADEYVYTGQGYTSYNMFAYCLNNPITYVDTDGTKPGANNVYYDKGGGDYITEAFIEYVKRQSEETKETIIEITEDDQETTGPVWPTGDPHYVGDFPYYYGTTTPHNGTDIGRPEGTAVYAVMSGEVETVCMNYDNTYNIAGSGATGMETYGNYIDISVGDLTYRYAHLQNSNFVSPGDTVVAGQQIGFVGNTGNSYGAHLHFEVIVWDGYSKTRMNPKDYLPPINK